MHDRIVRAVHLGDIFINRERLFVVSDFGLGHLGLSAHWLRSGSGSLLFVYTAHCSFCGKHLLLFYFDSSLFLIKA